MDRGTAARRVGDDCHGTSILVLSACGTAGDAAQSRTEQGEPCRSAVLGTLAAPLARNWQSEFLAVGSMVILSVYLRQRGSPESEPVGAHHGETAAEG